MSKTAVITARIDEETLAGLDRLAAHYERSRAWIVVKTLERRVKEELDYLAMLKEGEDAIECGDYFTQEEMLAWFAEKSGRAVDQAAE